MILPILASSAKRLEPSRVFDGISLSQSRKESLYLYYKEVGWFPRSPGHFVRSLLSCGLKQMQISVGVDFLIHGSSEMDILKIKFQESTPLCPMFSQHSCWSAWMFGFHTLHPSLSIRPLIFNKLWLLRRKEKGNLPLTKLWEMWANPPYSFRLYVLCLCWKSFSPFCSVWPRQNSLSGILGCQLASS